MDAKQDAKGGVNASSLVSTIMPGAVSPEMTRWPDLTWEKSIYANPLERNQSLPDQDETGHWTGHRKLYTSCILYFYIYFAVFILDYYQ